MPYTYLTNSNKKCDFDLLVHDTHISYEYMWHVDDTMRLFIYTVRRVYVWMR